MFVRNHEFIIIMQRCKNDDNCSPFDNCSLQVYPYRILYAPSSTFVIGISQCRDDMWYTYIYYDHQSMSILILGA